MTNIAMLMMIFGANQIVIQSHMHVAGPRPTKIVQAGGASCPAGTILVSASSADGQRGLRLDKVELNGTVVDAGKLAATIEPLKKFAALRDVEVGCYSKSAFIVNIYGTSPESTSYRFSFLVEHGRLKLLP